MIAVFKREFHAYFHSPLGYVFIAVMYFFTAYYFFMGNLVPKYDGHVVPL